MRCPLGLSTSAPHMDTHASLCGVWRARLRGSGCAALRALWVWRMKAPQAARAPGRKKGKKKHFSTVSSGHGILRIPRYPGDTVSSGYHWHPGDTAASSGCHWCPADSRISLRTCTYIGVITSGEKSACIKEIGRHHGFRPNKSGVPCFLTPTCKLRHMESTRRSWRIQ